VSAPLVFVGYGLENAAFGLDDYKGLDVKGKIVVMLAGFPPACRRKKRHIWARARARRHRPMARLASFRSPPMPR
jgi:hypothetical protein